MCKARAKFALLLGCLLAECACACALDPSLNVSQYAHSAWKVRDGFGKGALTSLAQTPDGYLWIGTESGLLRFDGVHPVEWQPSSGQELPGPIITSLLASHDGSLWIGTFTGLANLRDGKLTEFKDLRGSAVTSILEAKDGTVWIGVYANSGGGICELDSGVVHCKRDDMRFGNGVMTLYEDHKGSLWLGTRKGLCRWTPGDPQFFSFPQESSGITSLAEDDQGQLLFSSYSGIGRLVDGRIQPYPSSGSAFNWRVRRMLRDRHGGLWVGTDDHGVVHIDRRGKTDLFSALDGLSGDSVSRLLEDREGSIWVATSDGIDRFREYAAATISAKQGLSAGVVAVLPARDGSLWASTLGGLKHYKDGTVSSVGSHGGTLDSEPTLDGELPLGPLGEDATGRIFVSTVKGLGYLQNGRYVHVLGIPQSAIPRAMTEGPPGELWVTTQRAGLVHLFQGQVLQQIPWSGLGRNDFASVITTDPSHRGLWLGFDHGEVAYFNNGAIRTSYSEGNGLGKGAVTDLRFGADGALWAATNGGLSRIKDGKVITLSGKNGLPCDKVAASIEDDEQAMWLYLACGFVRIRRSELDAWISDPSHVLRVTGFDASDGVRSHVMRGGFQPLMTRSADGKIWFLPWDGVSVIDPLHLPLNNFPPPVHIEHVIADDTPFDAVGGMRLPQHVHYLGIDYTALSLTIPEKVRFRVKLEGQDKDWRELVNVRHVEYTNLPPKHYRFRVLACNNSGVWNETGDSLDFYIPPAWYQTWWFHAACVVAFLLLLWAIYQRRIQELQAQEKKFREAVETMPALAFVSDPNGNRPFVNRGWLDYTGMSAEQASGSGWQKAIHPDDIKRVLEKWRVAQATGEPLAYETRMRRGSDGAWRWFQTRARPLFDGRGKVVKWCAVATDIEDRKRAEQLQADLAHVNRVSTLGELAASISHELNQPIAAAIMNADLTLHCLHRDPPDLTQIQERTTRIIQMGTLASEIIDRLRSLYKKEPPKRVVLAVNEVIGEMAELLRGQAMRHGASLRTDLADGLPNVIADRVQLQQVLMNLMLNGIEAMGETGGVLTVKSDIRPNGQMEISVNDTGPGLPPGKADQIFDAFFTTKPQGSGMGLAISKSIVESHGGQIWADGDGGHGATFHFTLPPAPVEAEIPVGVR
jgi:PAS domain S-box-containing protein